MEDWVYYSLSMTICIALSFLLSSIRPATGKPAAKPSLPPGPTALSLLLGPLLLLAWTTFNIEPIIRLAQSWYGPVFTIYLLPSFPVIFVADGATARRVLVQCGAAFADRPPVNLATRAYLTVIIAALRPEHMDPSGACSGATSPAKPSTHRPSAGTPQLEEPQFPASLPASHSKCTMKQRVAVQ
jgi:hypothetical protein